MDFPIELIELNGVMKTNKIGKSCGDDKITNEMINCVHYFFGQNSENVICNW